MNALPFEQYRIRNGRFKSNEEMGMNGLFVIPHPTQKKTYFAVIASDGAGWKHVSVHLFRINGTTEQAIHRTPTWQEMCFIKDLFFTPDETAIQFHPRASEYKNLHPYTLHLWKPTEKEIELPPIILV